MVLDTVFSMDCDYKKIQKIYKLCNSQYVKKGTEYKNNRNGLSFVNLKFQAWCEITVY